MHLCLSLAQVADIIPEIIEKGDPRALVFHARDNALQRVGDDTATRFKGWKRVQQFGLFFQPSGLDVVPLKEAVFKDAPKSPMKVRDTCGIGSAVVTISTVPTRRFAEEQQLAE